MPRKEREGEKESEARVKTLVMERNEAYGYGTGVPTSFGSDFNTMNYNATSYGTSNYLLGNTATPTPPNPFSSNPFFQPNYTTTAINTPFFHPNYNANYNTTSIPANSISDPNYNTTIPTYDTTNISINPFSDPNYNTILPTYNTIDPNYNTTFPTYNTTSISTNPFFNPNYNINIPTNIPSTSNLSPNYNFQQFTNTIGTTFPSAPLTSYNINNIGLAQNYENNSNMLVNSVQPQPQPRQQLNIGPDQINHGEAQPMNMGVNSAEHLGSFVFSDGETSGSINGSFNKKRRNVCRHKRSSFLPFDQFDYNQHVPAPEPARVCSSSLSYFNLTPFFLLSCTLYVFVFLQKLGTNII